MQILFTGNKPQKKTYSYSVKENNNSNVITFILDKVQESLDLSSLSCFVKVHGSDIDKDVPTVEVVEDKIHVNWTLLRKHTDSRLLSIQLQFEGHGDVVWQAEILQLVLSDTIKADEYIENKYPGELADHEDRIKYLEEHGTSIEFDEVPTEGSENPVKSNGIFLSLQDVIAIAEGKTQSFTISAETNPTFDSEEDFIEVSSFIDINGNTIDTTKLHIGDICLITQLEIPDRWVANIENNVAKLYRMETTKVDLSAYYTKLEMNTLLNGYALKSPIWQMDWDLYKNFDHEALGLVKYSKGKMQIINNILYIDYSVRFENPTSSSVSFSIGSPTFTLPSEIADLLTDLRGNKISTNNNANFASGILNANRYQLQYLEINHTGTNTLRFYNGYAVPVGANDSVFIDFKFAMPLD